MVLFSYFAFAIYILDCCFYCIYDVHPLRCWHLLSVHFCTFSRCNAKFLWKRIPDDIKTVRFMHYYCTECNVCWPVMCYTVILAWFIVNVFKTRSFIHLNIFITYILITELSRAIKIVESWLQHVEKRLSKYLYFSSTSLDSINSNLYYCIKRLIL